jgi:hypothetical protein
MGHGVSFVLQVQTARMSQGVSYLLGVAFYDSRGSRHGFPIMRKPKVSQRGARDEGVLWFWVAGRERWRLQAFANRSNKDGRFGN